MVDIRQLNNAMGPCPVVRVKSDHPAHPDGFYEVDKHAYNPDEHGELWTPPEGFTVAPPPATPTVAPEINTGGASVEEALANAAAAAAAPAGGWGPAPTVAPNPALAAVPEAVPAGTHTPGHPPGVVKK